jgi:hypothetical protein
VRSLLVSFMLLIAIIVLYEHTIGGDEGSFHNLHLRGELVNEGIEGIDP